MLNTHITFQETLYWTIIFSNHLKHNLSLNEVYKTCTMYCAIKLSKMTWHITFYMSTTRHPPHCTSSHALITLHNMATNDSHGHLCVTNDVHTGKMRGRWFILSEWYITKSVNWCQNKMWCIYCNTEIKPATYIEIKRAEKWVSLTNMWGNAILCSIHLWAIINKTEVTIILIHYYVNICLYSSIRM
jgi:hypothetical protein